MEKWILDGVPHRKAIFWDALYVLMRGLVGTQLKLNKAFFLKKKTLKGFKLEAHLRKHQLSIVGGGSSVKSADRQADRQRKVVRTSSKGERSDFCKKQERGELLQLCTATHTREGLRLPVREEVQSSQ